MDAFELEKAKRHHAKRQWKELDANPDLTPAEKRCAFFTGYVSAAAAKQAADKEWERQQAESQRRDVDTSGVVRLRNGGAAWYGPNTAKFRLKSAPPRARRIIRAWSAGTTPQRATRPRAREHRARRTARAPARGSPRLDDADLDQGTALQRAFRLFLDGLETAREAGRPVLLVFLNLAAIRVANEFARLLPSREKDAA